MNEQNQIESRKSREKIILLEQFKKTPIVQIACEKTNIGRASYYRWRKEDQDFAIKADQALQEGSLLINDMAESQLISAIKDRNLSAIIFWLKSHHNNYKTKVELTGKLEVDNKELTPEQKELIEKALKLAGLDKNPYEGEQ